MSRRAKLRPTFGRAAASAFGVVAAAASYATDPVPGPVSDLHERERVRLRTVRLRLEPVWSAPPGACLELGVEDLAVRLRGEPVTDAALRLERERLPAVHALLIDTSESMFGQLDWARNAAVDYLETLPSAEDRAMVVSFDESVILVHGVTADRSELVEAVERVSMGKMTSMIDALYYAVLELSGYRERPVVVMLTDGVDSSSFHERHDVYDLIETRPDLTVFTVGLALPFIRYGAPPGVNSTKKFLQRIAVDTNGRFFDVPTGSRLSRVYARVREMLENEATLTVVDPAPEAEPGRVRVKSRSPDCRVKVFRRRERTEDPWTEPIVDGPEMGRVAFPPPRDYEKPYIHSMPPKVDPACRAAGDAGNGASGAATPGYLDVTQHRLSGCALDVILEYGLLYEPYREAWVHRNGWIGLRTRPIDVPLASVDALPTGPEAAMDRVADLAVAVLRQPVEHDPRLVPHDAHARPYHDVPLLVQGARFLEARPGLARALYAHPGFHTWARERFDRETADALASLRARYRGQFPDVDETALDVVIRETDAGREIRRREAGPSELDLQRHLAGWLGDISAHELFVRWEVALANRERSDPVASWSEVVERWTAARRLFFVPSYTRVLAILSPTYDPRVDRIGFWRVVLPRPGWLMPRVQGYKRHPEYTDLPLDLVPDLPFGLWVLRELRRSPERLPEPWRRRELRVRSLSYSLLGIPRKQGPDRAFRDLRVTIELGAPTAPDVLVLEADLHLDPDRDEPELHRLAQGQEAGAAATPGSRVAISPSPAVSYVPPVPPQSTARTR